MLTAEKIAEQLRDPKYSMELAKVIAKGDRVEIYTVRDEVKALSVSKTLVKN